MRPVVLGVYLALLDFTHARVTRQVLVPILSVAEVMVSRGLFQHILDAIAALRPLPPARC